MICPARKTNSRRIQPPESSAEVRVKSCPGDTGKHQPSCKAVGADEAVHGGAEENGHSGRHCKAEGGVVNAEKSRRPGGSCGELPAPQAKRVGRSRFAPDQPAGDPGCHRKARPDAGEDQNGWRSRRMGNRGVPRSRCMRDKAGVSGPGQQAQTDKAYQRQYR